MKKLYQKSELLFSLVWIGIYIVLSSLADFFSDKTGNPKSITFAVHLALSVLLLLWIFKNGHAKYYGLCKTPAKAQHFLYYIPLAASVSVNTWFGIGLQMPIVQTLFSVGSMLCVGFLEEIIFRGFLFRAMEKKGPKSAAIVSSLTFGIGHILNLFNGNAQNFVSNLCQIVSAVAFGFLFVTVLQRGKTLLPCIFTHSALNALSAFANEAATVQTVGSSLFLCVLAVVYTRCLQKQLPPQDKKQKK